MRGYKFHAAQRGLPAAVAAGCVALALAGCSGHDQTAGNDGGNNGGPPPGPNACDNFFDGAVPGKGDAASHTMTSLTRTEFGTQIFDECTIDNQRVFRAAKIVLISNNFGGATLGDVTLQTDTGLIDSCAANAGGYRVQLQLAATGPTPEDATAAFDRITIAHNDTLQGNKLVLDTRVTIAPATAAPVFERCPSGLDPGTIFEPRVSIFAGLPKAPSYVFTFGKPEQLGGIVVGAGFTGSQANLTTDKGQIDFLGGHWDVTNLTTDQGAINVSGDHVALTATTTVGDIQATLMTVRGIDAQIKAGLGGIGNAEVILQPTGTPGFDLFADTTASNSPPSSAGPATIDVPGADVVAVTPPPPPGDAKHSKTSDFESRAIKVTVHASSQGGTASIHE